MAFRIGINLGDVLEKDGALFGDGVNVAARLEGLADTGGVTISEAVHMQVEGKLDLDLEYLGEQRVKNIAKPVRAYRVVLARETAASGHGETLPLPGKPSIAVLPFTNMSGDAEQEYFADGVSEDIITALSRLPGLFVIARNSSFIFKGKAADVTQVARELGVRYVLEGSVRKAGGQVRITAQLIDASSGRHVWAERYDGKLTEIFEFQDEITGKIVNSIGPELMLAEVERVRTKPPDNLDAWALTNRGFAHYWRWTRNDLAEAERLARRAIDLDPNNAQSLALLASVLIAEAVSGWVKPGMKYIGEALEAAKKAIVLDHRSARAHNALGLSLINHGRYDEAVNEVERAVELEPGSAEILTWCGVVLAFSGQEELAIERVHEAIRLNPRDPQIYGRYQILAWAFFALERYQEAVEAAGHLSLGPEDWTEARAVMVASLAHLGRSEEAASVLDNVRRVRPDYTLEYARKRLPYRNRAHTERFVEGLRKAGLDIPSER
jgi:adenylate cyclase